MRRDRTGQLLEIVDEDGEVVFAVAVAAHEKLGIVGLQAHHLAQPCPEREKKERKTEH
jgi:hypothetical protein